MTRRILIPLIALALVGCKAEPKASTPEPTPSASAASTDGLSDCKVLGAGESLLVQCAWPRSVTSVPLPVMTEDSFDKASERFFKRVAKADSTPKKAPLTLKSGQKALGAMMKAGLRDRSGKTVSVVLRAVGVDRGKSGLFVTCVALDDAQCLSDLDRVVSHPPSPTQKL